MIRRPTTLLAMTLQISVHLLVATRMIAAMITAVIRLVSLTTALLLHATTAVDPAMNLATALVLPVTAVVKAGLVLMHLADTQATLVLVTLLVLGAVLDLVQMTASHATDLETVLAIITISTLVIVLLRHQGISRPTYLPLATALVPLVLALIPPTLKRVVLATSDSLHQQS